MPGEATPPHADRPRVSIPALQASPAQLRAQNRSVYSYSYALLNALGFTAAVTSSGLGPLDFGR